MITSHKCDEQQNKVGFVNPSVVNTDIPKNILDRLNANCRPNTVEPAYYDFEGTSIKKYIVRENGLSGKCE